MSCDNARDTITTDQGHAVNSFELDDKIDDLAGGHTPYQVKSHCRVADGQWVAWIGKGFGNQLGDGTESSEWPVNIANSSWAWVGYFPDDGSPPTVFDLPLEPCFGWMTGRYSTSDACAIRFVLPGVNFAPNQKCEMQSWFSGALDIQVRSDGVTVWVAVLAQESVMYPWLSKTSRTDKCGIAHSSIHTDAIAEGLSPGENGAPFSHDTTASGDAHIQTWWQQSNVTGEDQDDPGFESSFRWQPARVTVFAGGIGGFNKLDTIEASYANSYNYGLIGHVEAAASPAEPGVLHLLWAEGGFFREEPATSWDGVSGNAGQRITYSRWSPSAKILDTNIAESFAGTVDESHQGATSFPSEWVWTDEYILRNEHGSPAALIWSWATDADPDITRTDGPTTLDPTKFAYFDLTSGEPVLVQLFDPSLIPTLGEAGFDSIPVGTINTFGTPSFRTDDVGHPGRSHFASSLYTDPTLENTAVYIIGLNFAGGGRVSAFYRIAADGSDTFAFLDGVRDVGYSIIDVGDAPRVAFSDFISEPRNIWIPAAAVGGGAVWHLPRTCPTKTWELLQAFPASTLPDAGVDLAGAWAEFGSLVLADTSPPSIVTDDVGDWLAAGGVVPPGQFSGGYPFFAAALRAKICRCCVLCGPVEIHAWHKTS